MPRKGTKKIWNKQMFKINCHQIAHKMVAKMRKSTCKVCYID